jgi:hypothetical protein
MSTDKLYDKWVNAKFEGKIVVSVTQKGDFKNLGISLINGRSYNTKLGDAMSVQLGAWELRDLLEALQIVQDQYLPPPEPKEKSE